LLSRTINATTIRPPKIVGKYVNVKKVMVSHIAGAIT
jgi:hypothetical protein